MRNHLHGLAQVVAAALAGDDLLVDAAGGEVVALGELGVGEALVVAQVEVGLRAVVGDEDLAVLERAHGARIDVQVGIELLAGDLQPAAFEQAADGGRRDALSQRRNHAAGYEDVLSHTVSPLACNGGFEQAGRPVSRSSGVSTPRDSYSVSTTRMR